MLTIRDMIIDAEKTLGDKKLLTDVKKVYLYENGEKTDKLRGFRYEIVCPDCSYEKIGVVVEGKQRLEAPPKGENVEVGFEDLEISFYFRDGKPMITAKASEIYED